MVAIVTDVHYRMSLALIRDLAQGGVEVITCEQDRCRDSRTSPALGALSRYVSRHVWLPGGTDGLEALLSLCRETGLGRDCRPGPGLLGAGPVRTGHGRHLPPAGPGVSGVRGPSSCCQCVEREDIRAYAARLTAETGLTGLAMFEFKEDRDGAPRLLECNPRVWGTFPLTRVSGSGIPLLWCALAWNAGNPDRQAPLPQPGPLPETKMIFAASDLMAAAGYARRGSPGRALGALGDFLNPWVRDGLFEWGDMAPALAYFRSLLAKERKL